MGQNFFLIMIETNFIDSIVDKICQWNKIIKEKFYNGLELKKHYILLYKVEKWKQLYWNKKWEMHKKNVVTIE